MERFLYGVARSYSECFRIYGEKKSFEWQQLASESPVFYTRTGALREVETYKLDGDPERFFRGSEIKKNGWRSLISQTGCRKKLPILRDRRFITTKTRIYPLSKEAGMVDLIHT